MFWEVGDNEISWTRTIRWESGLNNLRNWLWSEMVMCLVPLAREAEHPSPEWTSQTAPIFLSEEQTNRSMTRSEIDQQGSRLLSSRQTLLCVWFCSYRKPWAGTENNSLQNEVGILDIDPSGCEISSKRDNGSLERDITVMTVLSNVCWRLSDERSWVNCTHGTPTLPHSTKSQSRLGIARTWFSANWDSVIPWSRDSASNGT